MCVYVKIRERNSKKKSKGERKERERERQMCQGGRTSFQYHSLEKQIDSGFYKWSLHLSSADTPMNMNVITHIYETVLLKYIPQILILNKQLHLFYLIPV